MNIAIVTVHMNTGGIFTSLMNLLDELCAYGEINIDIYVLTGDEIEVKNKLLRLHNVHYVKVIKNTNIYYKSFSQQSGFINRLKKVFFAMLRRVMSNEKLIELILHKEPKKGGYDVAISYANGIWTEGAFNFSGGCEIYVLQHLLAKKKVAWIHSNPINLGFTKEICTRVYGDFDYVVNVSNGCKEIYDSICPEHKNKSIVIHNLCNYKRVEKLSYECNPYNSEKMILLTVARLDNKSKRLDRIAHICKKLKALDVQCEWHLVGDGGDRKFVEDLIETYNIKDYLIMEGHKDNPYVYMRNADLYVCTSDYEAYGIVIREAQILGLPVITTPITSAAELVNDCEDGVITERFSSEDILEKILMLYEDRKYLDRMKKCVITNHDRYQDNFRELGVILGEK